MQKIKELCKNIHDEMDDAEKYMDFAMKYKDTDRTLADVYADLSSQEISHAEKLGSLVSTQVNRMKQGADAANLANAQCIWTWEHEKMMECLAKVKLKQEMYRK